MNPVYQVLMFFFLGWTVIGLAGCGGGSSGRSSSTGSVTGIVSIDGELKTNVEVRLVSKALGTEFTTTTDSSGAFTFAPVIPGKYYVVYQDQFNNQYTEPKAGELAPRDVYVGPATSFKIIYTGEELPPGPPRE